MKAISAAYLTSEHFNMLTYASNNISLDPIPLYAPDGTLVPPTILPGSPPLRVYPDGYAQYQSALSANGRSLGSVSLGGTNIIFDYFDALLDASRGLSFAPVQTLHVDMQLLLAGNASSLDITNEFTLVNVPEPSTVIMDALGIVALVAWGWRRRSHT
jgi:hypothetical protein